MSWKGFLIGGSFRFNSFMQNVDKLFYDFDDLNRLPANGIGNIKNYRASHNKGDYVIDLRFAYDVTRNNRISLIINNLLNREYMLRPLNIMPPRTFVLQYTLKI